MQEGAGNPGRKVTQPQSGVADRYLRRKGDGTHGNDADIVRARRPAELIPRKYGGERCDQCRVCIRGDPAVDKHVLRVPELDGFWREKRRRGGAGTHQLPKRNLSIAIGEPRVVEHRLRIVGQRPGRSRSEVAHHNHQ